MHGPSRIALARARQRTVRGAMVVAAALLGALPGVAIAGSGDHASTAVPPSPRPPCVAHGPLWSITVPAIAGHPAVVLRRRTYVVGPQIYLSCARERAALVRIFARYPKHVRSGATLTGGPTGWVCRANATAAFSGQCRKGARAFFEWGPVNLGA